MHTLPDLAPHDPVEFLPSMLAFFDQHLRGAANDGAPSVAVMVQGAGWHSSPSWPPPGTSEMSLYAAADRSLGFEPGAPGVIAYEVDPTVGTFGNLFDPLGQGIGLPGDQAGDDAASLSFTSAPLSDAMILTGSPMASLDVEFEGRAHLVARLCDVAPSGRSSLITSGWQRADASGRHDIQLWATAYEVPPGHRLRLAISGSDFPRIWPTATNPTLNVHCDGSTLRIPVAERASLTPLAMTEPDPTPDRAPLSLDFEPRLRVIRDGGRDEVSVETGIRSVMNTPSGGGRVVIDHLGRVTVDPNRPGDARAIATTTVDLDTPSGETVQVRSRSRATRTDLRLEGNVDVDGLRYFERVWTG